MRLSFGILGWAVNLTTGADARDEDDTVQAIAGPAAADLTVAPRAQPTTYEPEDRVGFR